MIAKPLSSLVCVGECVNMCVCIAVYVSKTIFIRLLHYVIL